MWNILQKNKEKQMATHILELNALKKKLFTFLYVFRTLNFVYLHRLYKIRCRKIPIKKYVKL